MAKTRNVWGLDIGQCALKALKLTESEGVVQVDAFEIVEHAKILSEPEVDRGAIIHDGLMQFLATHNIRGCTLAVAVPGQSSFTRFVKLPPVEKKRIPDIVRFEAEQQIPFPIDEVIWQWQTFQDPDSPDVEVGIFAMKRGDVGQILQHFTDVGVEVDLVQMAPLSLYNFLSHDGQAAEEGATLLADVGADKTDLVVSDGARIWTRTIQIGGNSFTNALVRAFKLSFEKAEKLKRTAASSKYARQIFQAMRPVFADLVQEIQRSIGYYTSLHRDSRFQKLVGLGNGFRLPGLQKFLEQNLNIPVARVDSYNNLSVSGAVNAPQFSENALSFAVAYGLAVQGLGHAQVDTNLLPGEILRRRQWGRKRPWFAAAAVVLLACLAGPIYRAMEDAGDLEAGQPKLRQVQNVVGGINGLYKKLRAPITDPDTREPISIVDDEGLHTEATRLLQYRSFWPLAEAMIFRAVGQVVTDQEKLAEHARDHEQWVLKEDERTRRRNAGETDAQLAELNVRIKDLEKKMKGFLASKRQSRKVIIIESWSSQYVADLKLASLSEPGSARERDRSVGELPPGGPAYGAQPKDKAKTRAETPRGFIVRLSARTHMGQDGAIPQILTPLQRTLVGLSQEIEGLAILEYPEVRLLPSLGTPGGAAPRGGAPRPPRRVREMPTDLGGEGPGAPAVAGRPGGEEGPQFPDPLLPTEDMAEDTRFMISFKLAVTGTGLDQKSDEKTEDRSK